MGVRQSPRRASHPGTDGQPWRSWLRTSLQDAEKLPDALLKPPLCRVPSSIVFLTSWCGRAGIAQKLGGESFVDVGYMRMQRLDYGRAGSMPISAGSGAVVPLVGCMASGRRLALTTF